MPLPDLTTPHPPEVAQDAFSRPHLSSQICQHLDAVQSLSPRRLNKHIFLFRSDSVCDASKYPKAIDTSVIPTGTAEVFKSRSVVYLNPGKG
ncbi:predicted protein [Botrytis cinerea T4]|uniref:Uncharacterized protein n=1 Tax=Botryotinia fuckeliana (strain T4) TaxID=999810 RepID=G2YST0_BOTF4|nr:predicted protein [Botrytis cinerea T4]